MTTTLVRPGLTRRACCDLIAGRPDVELCATCAPTICGSCRYLHGQHAPSCAAGRCRGCGARTALGAKHFCDACRAQRCPECGLLGGRHGARCRYHLRRRRPPLTTVYGVTTADDLVALFTDAYGKAVSIARYVGELNRPAAEDVVSDVFLYLWEKRDLLRAPPGRAYLFKAVTHGAIRARTNAWARTTVAMDPEDLVLAEQMTHPARARTPDTTVRLPMPV